MLTHGPLIVDLSATRAQIWARTAAPAVAQLRCGTEALDQVAQIQHGEDHTVVALLEGLQPNTAYVAELVVDGEPASPVQFTTMPPDGDPAELRLAFASDAFREYPAPALAHIRGLWPHGLFIIGDWDHRNYLANTSTPTGALTKARAAHRELRGDETAFGADFHDYIATAGIPVVGHEADDHDRGFDNTHEKSKYQVQVRQVLREYWPPPADHGFDLGYTFKSVRIGRTLFALLDTRSHREMPGAHRRLLGDAQWTWLTRLVEQVIDGATTGLDRLLLVSPVPYNPNQRKLDSWWGYADERQRLLDTVAPLLPARVLLISGDCHWGSMVWPPLSPITELNIPKIQTDGFANTCNHQPAQWSVTSAAPGGGFGLVTIRPTEMLLEIYNADGTRRLDAVMPSP